MCIYIFIYICMYTHIASARCIGTLFGLPTVLASPPLSFENHCCWLSLLHVFKHSSSPSTTDWNC